MTNPVTRHWSVAAAAHRSLSDDGSRTFLGIAPGDSAVHTAGLQPATPKELERYVGSFREQAPRTVSVMVAVGGPNAVKRAGMYADDLLLGQGASTVACETLVEHVKHVDNIQTWLFLMLNLTSSSCDLEVAREQISGPILGMSRNAFNAGFGGKDVPESLIPELEAMYSRYDFMSHALPGDTYNSRLVARYPRAKEFLLDRFGLVGEPAQVIENLHQISEETGVNNFVLSMMAPESEALMRRASREIIAKVNG
jgi:alkanesulfonate monooxygenase SsuD/methylene tetrahydromethanopterin reductase-like flavin-dependent oxidoreductase (luciferase family)